MAHPDWDGRLRCSYKKATFVLCAGNVVVALYMLHAVLGPLYFQSSPLPVTVIRDQPLDGALVPGVTYSREEMKRIETSNQLRRTVMPVQLMERVKEIQEETEVEISKTEELNLARQKVASELAQRLRELKLTNSQFSTQALEEWRKKKLAGAKKREDNQVVIRDEVPKSTQSGWLLSEGVSISDAANADDKGDKEDNSGLLTMGLDMEHELIPGRPLPVECHPEAHTDYDGTAVRWGLTYHVESAADCCQACLDHARNAKDDEKKCNIWVYCPEEGGCHSPDRYKHKHGECWLKQANQPETNFKGQYDEEYRQQHPNAPLIVPWVSGVTSSR